MPEGDTVFRAARRLDEALAGDEVVRFDLRVPHVATSDLRGESVRGCVPRGKHLLLRIGEWTLHSHLKMEGEWHVYTTSQRWRRPAFQARAIVGTAGRTAVGFDLAMVDLVPTAGEDALVGHLGPDLLGPDWDAARAAENLSRDERPVHVALLDQRNLAGLGNEYANELLFVRGVLPTRPATEVEAAGLVETASRMIRANVDRVPRTFTGDTRPGRTTWVYGRERRPCRRCGTPVRSGRLGADPTRERNVFWCPTCQH
ncbi:DNA-formamidopyrimidine glycosylase family protein [Microbacterium sp. SORGH_AS_0888]|uniref:DNA-formamidopyrimidine glycosylase family protein n=1 Tax=Microbacterium sp. SORGH_AS_0888 TaxID=3041791 RepID=UPI002785E2C9|nr:DNA-formamidopyrimidine glycosylase family protein [Microbacterium sp. SORGH_AS_0888]MDQ1129417.1 endonuclease-8 [Microbacterium sp. SORGH_AS_0888]